MKSQFSAYVVVSVVLVVVWFFVALIPHSSRYSMVRNEINLSKQKLKDFQETIKLLPQYVKTRNELARQKAELNSSLYTKENLLSLFENFYALAKTHKVGIVEITPPIEELLQINRIVPDSVGLMFLNVTLRIEGDYRNFGRFVSALEEEPFYRGPNVCQVTGTNDRRYNVQYLVGFKSLLGSLKDVI